MEKVKQNLKEEREKKGISYADLAKITNIAKSTLQRYETGTTLKIPLDAIKKVADALNIHPSKLMGWDDDDELCSRQMGVKIPVYNALATKLSSETFDESINYEEISRVQAKKGEYFAMLVEDDSMEPRIKKRDVVIIRKQADAESQDLVLVRVDGQEATIKKLMKQDTGILLIPFNSKYPPMFYSKSEIKTLPIDILGKIVELRAKF